MFINFTGLLIILVRPTPCFSSDTSFVPFPANSLPTLETLFVKENLMAKVERLQEKITNLSERLSAVKDHLLETAAQAVNAFKEKGKSGCQSGVKLSEFIVPIK